MHFLDTNVLVGAADGHDDLHEQGKAILQKAATGSLGSSLVSDFVLDETLTLLARRRGIGPKGAVGFVRTILSSPRVRCVYLDSDRLSESMAVFERFGPTLNFTDASIVAIMKAQGCKILYSNDAGFDRVPNIERHPGTD